MDANIIMVKAAGPFVFHEYSWRGQVPVSINGMVGGHQVMLEWNKGYGTDAEPSADQVAVVSDAGLAEGVKTFLGAVLSWSELKETFLTEVAAEKKRRADAEIEKRSAEWDVAAAHEHLVVFQNLIEAQPEFKNITASIWPTRENYAARYSSIVSVRLEYEKFSRTVSIEKTRWDKTKISLCTANGEGHAVRFTKHERVMQRVIEWANDDKARALRREEEVAMREKRLSEVGAVVASFGFRAAALRQLSATEFRLTLGECDWSDPALTFGYCPPAASWTAYEKERPYMFDRVHVTEAELKNILQTLALAYNDYQCKATQRRNALAEVKSNV